MVQGIADFDLRITFFFFNRLLFVTRPLRPSRFHLRTIVPAIGPCLKISARNRGHEARPKAGQGEMPPGLIQKRCQHSSLAKLEDAFDTALDLTQTKPSDAALSTVFRTSINAYREAAGDIISGNLLG